MDYKDELIEFKCNNGIDDFLEEIEIKALILLDLSPKDRVELVGKIDRVVNEFCENEVNNNIATETDMLMDIQKDKDMGI